jgi:hypothetical protein
LLTAALILILPLIFFYQTALNGMIMARGDVYTYFYPYWAARSAAFLSGRFPLWEPNIFMGVPFLANSQAGVLYPPNLLVTPLPVPAAVTVSILLHAAWAMLGMMLLARRALGLERIPALLAGALFAYGGYLGAQVEHVNQFQALAWLPHLLLAYHAMRRRPVQAGLLLGAALALQLLAGHPQTVFISLVGLGVVALTAPLPLANPRTGVVGWLLARLRTAGLLALPVALALVLAAPQLVPTLELTRESQRSSGMGAQAAMSFSLNPFLIGRGLLPSYDGLVFTEYIAYGGVIGFGLAAFGLAAWVGSLRCNFPSPLQLRGDKRGEDRWWSLAPFVALLIVGLALAFGAYNPLYWLLANLPGFSFFRVPARWLALLALAGAALAGAGLQSLIARPPSRRVLAGTGALLLALAAAAFLADRAAEEIVGPALPTLRTLLAWGAALVVLLLGARLAGRKPVPLLLALAVGVELFAAAHTLAYNQVVPEDVYSAPRFMLNQLRAETTAQTPPGRYLGISPLEFDPGDVDRLNLRYQSLGLSEIAIRTALVATKMREIAAPNLPLVWNIPSIDGFDGGLLPSDSYAAFSRLLVPAGEDAAVDGRLRERLALPDCRGACLPELRWLNLTNTRYLALDKTGDVWFEGVAYDLALPQALAAGQPLSIVTDNPPFEATALDLLLDSADAPALRVTFTDGTQAALLPDGEAVAAEAFWRVRYPLPDARTPQQVDVTAQAAQTLGALTLVDTRTGDFQQVTLGAWRRILSSDIKLYENLNVLLRAFVVPQAVSAANEAAAIDLLRDPAFDPAQTVVLMGADAGATGGAGTATITRYASEQIELTVSAPQGGWLLLTDADYPGWRATVNESPAAIVRADGLFRAVRLPAGESRVTFAYQPAWWPGVLVFGAAAWLLWAAGVGWRSGLRLWHNLRTNIPVPGGRARA